MKLKDELVLDSFAKMLSNLHCLSVRLLFKADIISRIARMVDQSNGSKKK